MRGSVPRYVARRAALTLPPVRRLLSHRDHLLVEREELRREIDRLRAGARHRDDLSYLFVMTYGRSGSTLLQAILNATPGVLIRGENRGIVHHLHTFHATALEDAVAMGERSRRRVHPFFGIHDYPADIAVEHFRALLLDTVLRPGPRTRVTGFKEIRWYQDDLPEYVDFLRTVFPGARFIVNTRRLADVARSNWWAHQPDALQQLERIEERILEVAQALGESAYHLRYDDYVADPARLKDLFAWLGEEYDEQRVVRVMEQQRYAEVPDKPRAEEADR